MRAAGGVRSCVSKSNARDGTEREKHRYAHSCIFEKKKEKNNRLKGSDELVNSCIHVSRVLPLRTSSPSVKKNALLVLQEVK